MKKKLIKKDNCYQFNEHSDDWVKVDKKSIEKEEKKIIELLQIEELSIDDLSLKLNIDIASLSTQISLLSLKNIIEENNNKLSLVSP